MCDPKVDEVKEEGEEEKQQAPKPVGIQSHDSVVDVQEVK